MSVCPPPSNRDTLVEVSPSRPTEIFHQRFAKRLSPTSERKSPITTPRSRSSSFSCSEVGEFCVSSKSRSSVNYYAYYLVCRASCLFRLDGLVFSPVADLPLEKRSHQSRHPANVTFLASSATPSELSLSNQDSISSGVSRSPIFYSSPLDTNTPVSPSDNIRQEKVQLEDSSLKSCDASQEIGSHFASVSIYTGTESHLSARGSERSFSVQPDSELPSALMGADFSLGRSSPSSGRRVLQRSTGETGRNNETSSSRPDSPLPTASDNQPSIPSRIRTPPTPRLFVLPNSPTTASSRETSPTRRQGWHSEAHSQQQASATHGTANSDTNRRK